MKLAYHEVNKLRATRNSVLRMAAPHLRVPRWLYGFGNAQREQSCLQRRRSWSSKVTSRATVIDR
jgi:hypothetical protein